MVKNFSSRSKSVTKIFIMARHRNSPSFSRAEDAHSHRFLPRNHCASKRKSLMRDNFFSLTFGSAKSWFDRFTSFIFLVPSPMPTWVASMEKITYPPVDVVMWQELAQPSAIFVGVLGSNSVVVIFFYKPKIFAKNEWGVRMIKR